MGIAIITVSIDSLFPSFKNLKQAFIKCLLSIRAASWDYFSFIPDYYWKDLLFYNLSRILFDLGHVIYIMNLYS